MKMKYEGIKEINKDVEVPEIKMGGYITYYSSLCNEFVNSSNNTWEMVAETREISKKLYSGLSGYIKRHQRKDIKAMIRGNNVYLEKQYTDDKSLRV